MGIDSTDDSGDADTDMNVQWTEERLEQLKFKEALLEHHLL